LLCAEAKRLFVLDDEEPPPAMVAVPLLATFGIVARSSAPPVEMAVPTSMSAVLAMVVLRSSIRKK
jgi:hypothetical protein